MRALSASHDLSGLIAWARRDDWRDALAERIERHAANPCAGAGIAVADIESLLGPYGVSTLWGAAFEDLLATDLPDGRNIADDYLRRRGWKESVATREYIGGLRRSVISLYEVSSAVPGESMTLRDLAVAPQALEHHETGHLGSARPAAPRPSQARPRTVPAPSSHTAPSSVPPPILAA